ncbi:MAG: hypothetical protein H0W05_04185 [Thermoleophilaceae bacterium]|jgi:hypothetical protein|nr:hypothetical protein [Thermoleophilaceae bacterium]
MDRIRLPTSRAGRIAAGAATALVLLLVLSQLLLPGIGEGAVEDRLTENGGAADVSLSAKPAARLLLGDGDRIEIDATGLDLEIARANDPVVFDDLDRFGDVEIVIADSTVGPVRLEHLVLSRNGDEPYSLEATGTTSLADLAGSAGEDFEVPGSDLLGAILNATGVGGSDLALDLDMRLESDGGRVRVLEGGGEVAGIPTGPLAELIASAIVVEV